MSKASKQDQTIPTNAATVLLPPSGWYLKENLSPQDLQNLVRMRTFCQDGLSQVAAMSYAVNTFQQNQVYLAPFLSRDQNHATHAAIRQMMQTTSTYWHHILLVYAEYLMLGFHPIPNAK